MNRLRLRHLVRQEVPGAQTIEYYLNHPDRLLGTLLVGNNLCNVFLTIIAAKIGADAAGPVGASIAGFLIIVVVLVLGEYIPKSWFQSFPTARVLPFARLLDACSRLLWPISRGLTYMVSWVAPVPKDLDRAGHPMVSREELAHLAHEGTRSGALTADEGRMIRGVFVLKEIPCSKVMTPRARFVQISTDASAEDILALAREKSFNRFPVFDPVAHAYVGLVNVFDVLADEAPQGKRAKDYMRTPPLVAVNTPVDHVLPRMRVARQPMMLVTDERMDVVGLVTIDDVLEEVVGDL
jgi:CBS domain containing-hemolysin-like protein